jgi:O-antigen ligase
MQIINFGPIELYQVVQGVSPYFRYSSLTDNPNTLGSIFIFTIPMTIYAIYSKYLSTSKGIIFMTLQLISLYMTRSRTSIITIVLLFIFYYIFFSERNKTLKKISMIIVPIISLFFILRFKTSLLLALRLSSLDTSGRIDAWKIGLSYIINRPLIGVGFGVSQEELLEPLGYNITFHNIYITLLTEIGIVGFIIILYIWINTIIKGLIYINKLENCEKLRMSLIISVLILFVLLAHQFFEVQILRYGIHTFYWIYLLGYINNEYIKS